MEKNQSAKTFEQVNHLVEEYYAPKSQLKSTATSLATIWVVARPILNLVASLGIIPTKWRNCIKDLIAVIDVIATKA